MIFKGIGTSIAKEPNIFAILPWGGVGTPCLPSGSAHGEGYPDYQCSYSPWKPITVPLSGNACSFQRNKRCLSEENGICLGCIFMLPGVEYIEDIYFFEVNTKYISSSAVKKSVFFTSA